MLAACAPTFPSKTPTEAALAILSPSDGAAISLENTTFQVAPVDQAEGYAWTFSQFGVVLWDTIQDEQRLTGATYQIPATSTLVQRAVPGQMQVQVRARINGQWSEPAGIMVVMTAPASPSGEAGAPAQPRASPTPVAASRGASQTILFAGGGKLYALEPNTKSVTLLMQKMDYVIHSIAVDFARKHFYMDAEYSLWRAPFAQTGNPQPALEYLDTPQLDINQGLDIDPATGQIFLGQYYSGVFTRNINDATWAQIVSPQDIAPLLGQRGQLQIDPVNKHIYFRTAFNGECSECRWIYRMDYDGRNLTKIVQANGGDALALDLQAGKIYFSDIPTNATIKRANLDGTQIETLPSIPNKSSYHCWKMAVDNQSGKLYLLLGDQKYSGTMTIVRMNLDGSEFEIMFETNETRDGEGALTIISSSLEQFTSGLSVLPEVTAPPPPPFAPTPTAARCDGGWSRLQVGVEAVVLPGAPNRVRSEPKKGGNLISKLYPGDRFTIISGPECADGLVFWLVSSPSIPGGYGWTAEGDGKEYWLEPVK